MNRPWSRLKVGARALGRSVRTADGTTVGAPSAVGILPLGVGSKLTLAFASLAAVTLLVVLLALLAGRSATNEINLTEEVRAPAWIAAEQAQASLLKMQLHVRGYLVLGDPMDIEQYHVARREFEKSLASLKAMSTRWPEFNEAKWVAELTQTYESWAKLPQQLFELHDDPLKNRPALRIARVDLQSLRVHILDEVDVMIDLQKTRELSPQNRGLMTDLLAFQTSFDAMATNLMAYATSGELNFKLAYGPQLATNAAIWNALSGKQARLSAEQRARLDAIARYRALVAELALQIVTVLNGEHAYEDLYLYRTEFAPQAEATIGLLAKVTSRQQVQLKTELARARQGLLDARTQTLAGGLVAVALGIVLAFVLRRTIVGPVRRLTEAAERVAAGDLSARAVVESKDEIGVLGESINTMTQRLAQTIEHLETVFADAQRAKDAAVVANRAKSIFLATMSHELRTPLNAILGFAHILQTDPQLSDRQARGVEIIRQGGEQLLTLINDILDLSRIEAGKIELHAQPVALPGFLRTVTDIINVKAEEKGLVFRFDAAPELAQVVRVDEKYLRQVLLNLLSNAVKFTERGQVKLQVQALGTSETGVRLRFEVVDSGIGIQPAQLQAIFEPFVQVADVQRRFGGTGLGLSISRQLVRLMGGDIHVESDAGEGSRFWFDLDLPIGMLEPQHETMQPRPPVAGYDGTRRKLLVVDDVAANRKLLVDYLSPLGFEMDEADDGESCLLRAQALQPDLIVMDSVMPVMDGLEATRRLRELPALKSVPIITVSASASATDKQKSLEVGASAFLPKPIELNKLLHEIGTLLHLTWIPVSQATVTKQSEERGALIAPPAHEMEILYGLAQTGNMRSIRAQADHLAALGASYEPFAQRLRELANSYQSRAILELVREFRDRSGQA
jgi:signal transduction histidine kinase/DNA-binding NarL/FixJ family response regulator/CHASE3 domain sensor protein